MPVRHLLLRHSLAFSGLLVAALVYWSIDYYRVYVGSSAVAQPDSGRFAIGASVILLEAMAVGIVVFVPACATGGILRAFLRCPRWIEIMVVFGVGALLSCILYFIATAVVSSSGAGPLSMALRLFGLYLAVPLLAYWWVTRIRLTKTGVQVVEGKRGGG